MNNRLKIWRTFLGISSVILLVNILFIDWIWLKDRERINETVNRVNQLTNVIGNLTGAQNKKTTEIGDTISNQASGIQRNDNCGPLCQRIIDKKISEALNKTTTPINNTTIKTSTSSSPSNTSTVISKSGTYYIPLSGTGSTTGRDWTNIPTTETVINWSEYGSNDAITWDAYGKIYQGNGKSQFRLYDKTNNVAIPNSELETSSETSVHLISGNLTVWSGTNTYIVQVKSLTGYEAFFESGRIKVVVK